MYVSAHTYTYTSTQPNTRVLVQCIGQPAGFMEYKPRKKKEFKTVTIKGGVQSLNGDKGAVRYVVRNLCVSCEHVFKSVINCVF